VYFLVTFPVNLKLLVQGWWSGSYGRVPVRKHEALSSSHHGAQKNKINKTTERVLKNKFFIMYG
jgi:hypothetical protein